ncbi:hypothetical protein DM02DRAFT_694869 [Periconia macrospinosa]|uniref:Uncharacterized protein n=1 Tax=Periconia macrospinosa TaxID=97972 RepID=A0A2V1D701_9PLEO|nr:hypothetical protein DM02DRAFT_694869 [Periconia macrospinosa]
MSSNRKLKLAQDDPQLREYDFTPLGVAISHGLAERKERNVINAHVGVSSHQWRQTVKKLKEKGVAWERIGRTSLQLTTEESDPKKYSISTSIETTLLQNGAATIDGTSCVPGIGLPTSRHPNLKAFWLEHIPEKSGEETGEIRQPGNNEDVDEEDEEDSETSDDSAESSDESSDDEEEDNPDQIEGFPQHWDPDGMLLEMLQVWPSPEEGLSIDDLRFLRNGLMDSQIFVPLDQHRSFLHVAPRILKQTKGWSAESTVTFIFNIVQDVRCDIDDGSTSRPSMSTEGLMGFLIALVQKLKELSTVYSEQLESIQDWLGTVNLPDVPAELWAKFADAVDTDTARLAFNQAEKSQLRELLAVSDVVSPILKQIIEIAEKVTMGVVKEDKKGGHKGRSSKKGKAKK